MLGHLSSLPRRLCAQTFLAKKPASSELRRAPTRATCDPIRGVARGPRTRRQQPHVPATATAARLGSVARGKQGGSAPGDASPPSGVPGAPLLPLYPEPGRANPRPRSCSTRDGSISCARRARYRRERRRELGIGAGDCVSSGERRRTGRRPVRVCTRWKAAEWLSSLLCLHNMHYQASGILAQSWLVLGFITPRARAKRGVRERSVSNRRPA
jgi:hypothetical protein